MGDGVEVGEGDGGVALCLWVGSPLSMARTTRTYRAGSGDLSVSEVVLNGAPQEILK